MSSTHSQLHKILRMSVGKTDMTTFMSKQKELRDLILAEETSLLKNKIKKILNQEYQLGLLGDLHNNLKDLEQQNLKKLSIQTAKLRCNGWLWVTVNPQNTVSLDSFIKSIKKINTYTSIDASMYVFEQRGTIADNNIGKGFHAHILIKRNLSYKPSALISKLQRGLVKIVKDVKAPHLLNMHVIGDEFALDKIRYMIGAKKTEKQEKQLADVQWRQENNLEKLYKKNNF